MVIRDLQKQRTRLALIDAAVRLVGQGQSPTLAEVAEEALVSTATAYRYFSSMRPLLLEVATRQLQPTVDELLGELPADPEQRLDQMVDRVASMQLRHEALWRGVLSAIQERWFEEAERPPGERVPVRGITRVGLVEGALAPLRETLPADRYRKLSLAITLVFGAEAMVSARDVCGLDVDESREIMRWSARTLLRAVLAESAGAPADTDGAGTGPDGAGDGPGGGGSGEGAGSDGGGNGPGGGGNGSVPE